MLTQRKNKVSENTAFSQLADVLLYITGPPGRLRKPYQPRHALIEALAGCDFFAVWSQPPGKLWIFLRFLNHNLLAPNLYKLRCSCAKCVYCCMGCLREIHSRPYSPACQCNRNLTASRLASAIALSPSRAARESILVQLRINRFLLHTVPPCVPSILLLNIQGWAVMDYCNRRNFTHVNFRTLLFANFPYALNFSYTVNPEYFVCTKFLYVGNLRPFVLMRFSYSRWPLRILWLALYLSYALYFRAEATTYEMYENKMHAKYFGFTVASMM